MRKYLSRCVASPKQLTLRRPRARPPASPCTLRAPRARAPRARIPCTVRVHCAVRTRAAAHYAIRATHRLVPTSARTVIINMRGFVVHSGSFPLEKDRRTRGAGRFTSIRLSRRRSSQMLLRAAGVFRPQANCVGRRGLSDAAVERHRGTQRGRSRSTTITAQYFAR